MVGEAAIEDCITCKRLINDQAYFVLAWGQLEADIDKACRHLSGLSFENRMTLVPEKGSGD